jgi:S1-C subfamily serine protease
MSGMAVFSALEFEKNREKYQVGCIGDVSSFNFIADAASVASPAVVNVVANVTAGGLGLVGQSSGSGFIIDSTGLVATNAHVVSHGHRGSTLTITLNDGRKFTGKVHSLDRQLDIALIQLDVPTGTELPTAKIGNSGELKIGEWVVALGSPLRLQNTVTAGIISSVARGASEIGMGDQSYEYLQTDAAINQGNSGGPLVNLRGEVIGINTAKLGGNLVTGISFAIPIDVAWQVIHQLRSYGNVRRPYLGIKFVRNSSTRRNGGSRSLPYIRNGQQFSSSEEVIQIAEVISGSPADQGGLREGDIILEFDHRKVTKMSDIIERLGYEYGRLINLKVRRNGEDIELTVKSSKPNGYGR